MSKAENLASLLNASGLIDSDDLAAGSVTDPKFGGSIFVNSSGNVGIGTTSPGGKLGLGSTTPSFQLIETDGTATHDTTSFRREADQFYIQTRRSDTAGHVSNDVIISSDSNGAYLYRWQIADTEAMRLNSNGVGIGTNPSQALEVVGNIVSSGTITDDRGTVREFGDGIFTNATNYTIPSGSSGQCIRLGSGVSTITVDANNLADGEIITIINQNNVTPRIDFINCSLGARVGGVNANYNGVTGPTIQAYGVCTIIAPVQTRVFITGNLTI